MANMDDMILELEKILYYLDEELEYLNRSLNDYTIKKIGNSDPEYRSVHVADIRQRILEVKDDIKYFESCLEKERTKYDI